MHASADETKLRFMHQVALIKQTRPDPNSIEAHGATTRLIQVRPAAVQG